MTDRLQSTDNHFQGELTEGESLLWAGQPDSSAMFTRIDKVLVPFSLVWEGVAVAALIEAVNGQSAVAIVVSALFVTVGAYLVAGRFFYRQRLRRRTYYAVTDRRVLVLNELPTRSLQTAFVDQVPVINKWLGFHGTGTLQFGSAPMWESAYGSTGLEILGRPRPNTVPVFADVQDPERVYQLVSGLRQTGQTSRERADGR
jgi:hypothetical protein